MKKTLTFRAWLRQFENQQNAIGDLARDIRDDKNETMPRRSNDRAKWAEYLCSVNAVSGAMDALDAAFDQYNSTNGAVGFWSAANRAFTPAQRRAFNEWRMDLWIEADRLVDLSRSFHGDEKSRELSAQANKLMDDIGNIPGLEK